MIIEIDENSKIRLDSILKLHDLSPCNIGDTYNEEKPSKMMPPKKSKAARKAVDEVPKNDEDAKKDNDGDQKEVNIFRVQVVEGKRARSVPAGESGLNQWLKDNIEEKEGHNVVAMDAYENYVSSCVSQGSFAVSQYEFFRALKKEFPKGSSIKESSSYFALIRVKKAKKDDGESKKKAKTGPKISMKEVVTTVIHNMGNPKRGLMFNTLKTHVAAQCPALQLDKRPKFLLAYLERCVRFGSMELVRGIGRCGLYRLPGPADEEEEEQEEEDTKKKPKENGEVNDEGDDKKEEEEKKEDEDDKEGGTSKDEEKEESKETKKKGKGKAKDGKKKKKKAATSKQYRSFVMHSDPQRVEDAFSLAMTYMVEPKEASVQKVRKYLEDYYIDEVDIESLRECLESGNEKGYWELVHGQGITGRYRLLMDEFDPTADDDLTGQIMNALVACTEPKQCSAALLKAYLIEYHPEFKIAEKPHLFKRALERGLSKKVILRLSGIGASGSFQLYDPFTPTPLILKGEDTESDYESESEGPGRVRPSWKVADDEGQGYGQFHISTFQDAYKPRPSKRRGHGREASTGIKDEPAANKVSKLSRFRATSARTGRGKKKVKHASSEDEAPQRKRSTKSTGRMSPRKQKRKSYAVVDSSSSSSHSEDEDSGDEAPPPPKRARPPPTARKQLVKKDKTPAKKKPTPAKKGKVRTAPPAPESSSDEDEGSGDEATPPAKPAGKGGKTPRRKTGKETPRSQGRQTQQKSARGMYTEASTDEDEFDDEDAPPPKKSPSKTPVKSGKKGRKGRRK